MLFHKQYEKFHIGNINEMRFKDIFHSERYWEVMDYIASEQFNAQTECGTNCLQHKTNEVLWKVRWGEVQSIEENVAPRETPQHVNFI